MAAHGKGLSPSQSGSTTYGKELFADLKPEWQRHIVAAPEGRRQHHLRMLGAISCRGLPQTDASYARGYLLAAMLGHHSDTGMECPENSRTSVVKHSQTEGSSARSYLLAIAYVCVYIHAQSP